MSVFKDDEFGTSSSIISPEPAKSSIFLKLQFCALEKPVLVLFGTNLVLSVLLGFSSVRVSIRPKADPISVLED